MLYACARVLFCNFVDCFIYFFVIIFHSKDGFSFPILFSFLSFFSAASKQVEKMIKFFSRIMRNLIWEVCDMNPYLSLIVASHTRP